MPPCSMLSQWVFILPRRLIGDARRHNVTVLPPDVNASRFACTVEPLPPVAASVGGDWQIAPGTVTHPWEHPVALRIGLSQVRGIGEKHKELLDAERARGPYTDLRDFVLRTQLSKDILESLAAVDAFACLYRLRREAFWDVQRIGNLVAAGGLERAMTVDEPAVALPAMRKSEEAAADFRGLGLSTRYQIMEFYRPQLNALRVRRACDLRALPNRLVLKVAGLVTTRQRPGTAKGFVFTTMEDETGLINVIIRPDIYQRYRSDRAG